MSDFYPTKGHRKLRHDVLNDLSICSIFIKLEMVYSLIHCRYSYFKVIIQILK